LDEEERETFVDSIIRSFLYPIRPLQLLD
jgi:hypothetical protein